MLPVIDAHHHIWRQADLAWLNGPMQPRIFGSYEAIRCDYLAGDFVRDHHGLGVVKSVYVQANWPAERCEEEAAWVQQSATETGWPRGIVAYADMLAPDVRPQLDRLARYPLVRGVRMQLHWHEKELYRFATRPDLCLDPVLQRNVARLADYGWAFDLQVFAGQMASASALADACPTVTFVLQHAGMLEDTSEAGMTAWREGMAALARRPNVVTKLSALGTFIRRNDPAHIAMIVRETIGMFGAERCLFGSNFPIEKLWTTYADLLAAHRAALAQLTETEQRAVLQDNAARVYRLM